MLILYVLNSAVFLEAVSWFVALLDCIILKGVSSSISSKVGKIRKINSSYLDVAPVLG